MIQQCTRFIPREAIGSVTQWQFAAIDAANAAPTALPPPAAAAPDTIETEAALPTVEETQFTTAVLEDALEEARQAAEAAGYARGLAEGLAQGIEQGQNQAAEAWQQRMDDYVQGQGQEVAQQWAELTHNLQHSLAALQQTAAQQVLQLACDIARQVVRHEVTDNPRALLPVVREALEMLAAEHQPVTVQLHPDDWAALEPALRAECTARRIEWQPDSSLTAGDCRVSCAGAVVDARVERRWQRAIAALGLTSVWKGGHDA